ncbi:DNAJ heat shock N-terminal domain-containing protein [Forsythia ovata]|uniref:DNAJ heat shock N-terminal domain-containing protein n=1 Tax=Forsythia ovata TaxID=205694 RepID=A0ABD1R3E6_9LAMI
MECNKDEAIRCKVIAEKKLKEEDIAGAKKFALKAETLFPTLDDLSQLLKVINFYDGYEKKINGEVNWYGILGVDPFADEDTLRKAHKRMALALHPDKNKSFGAEEAFKILSQARSVLFDKSKKLVYDLKLNFRAHERVSVGNPPFPADKNSFGNSISCSSSLSARNVATSGNAQHVPMCPRNTATATSSHCNPPPLWPRYPSTANVAQQIPSHQKIPETATCSQYVSTPPWPRDPTTASGARHMTPETSANSHYLPVCNNQNPPAIATNYRCFPTPLVPRNQTTTRHHHHTPAGNSLPIPSPLPSRPETFWTSCNKCRILFEFLKIYLNQTLMCPHCREPFLAKEKSAPTSGSIHGSRGPRSFHQQKPGLSAASGSSKNATASATRAAQTAQRVQSVGERLKRGREEAVSLAGSEEALQRNSIAPDKTDAPSASENPTKKRHIDGQKRNSVKARKQTTAGSRAANTISSGNLKGNLGAERVISASDESTSTKELSQSELRAMLMEKAKTEILKKLNQWSIAAELESANKKGMNMEKEKPSISINAMPKAAIDDLKINKNKCAAFLGSSKTSQPQKSSMCDGIGELNANVEETVLMSVPDANFCNFDKDRGEASFSDNQVWALYDDDDGMPRYYALIRNVMSRKPFKMQISWLNSKGTTEFGSLNWVSSGFAKTCGYFKVGKPEVSKSLSSFSHQLKWRKGPRGAIQIFPAKGDVWALYRNWSVDWNELTEDDVIHKYDVVVIVEDYIEEKGVVISPLVKVAGFTSVFCQHLDPTEIRTIPREEMFRFSHQVPSYELTGREAQNVPKGSRDLDPAALPLELLQLVTESEESVKDAENPVELKQLDGSIEAKKEPSRIGNANTEDGGASEDAKHAFSVPILKYSRRGKKKKMAGDADHAK